MTQKHRIFVFLTAILLIVSVLTAALAEGPLSVLYRAGSKLLFGTDNATLKASATFTYNGMPFKTLDADYLQDGVNSQMVLRLLTPREGSAPVATGFTVVGNGDTAYAIDPADNPYVYYTISCAESDTILSDTALRRTLVWLGSVAANITEGAFSEHITEEPANGGARYHVQLSEGQTPALLNAAGTLAFQIAASRYFSIDYDWAPVTQQPGDLPHGVTVLYDDYYSTFALWYERIYEEPLPEDFYTQLWGENSAAAQAAQERYDAVNTALDEELVSSLEQEYDHGVAAIRADGSVDYYETSDRYYVDNDLQTVDFENYEATFCAYYQKTTGEELTADTLRAIFYSNNPELLNSYNAMYDQMMAEYMDLVRADGKASVIYVHADGSYHMIYDIDAYNRSMRYDGRTMTRRILETMASVALGDCDFTVALDEAGRITAAKGTVDLIITDLDGLRNTLEITFDATAGRYGETEVADFDPAAFGVMSWEEFSSLTPTETSIVEHTPDLPESIMFEGVQYQVLLEGEPAEEQ